MIRVISAFLIFAFLFSFPVNAEIILSQSEPPPIQVIITELFFDRAEEVGIFGVFRFSRPVTITGGLEYLRLGGYTHSSGVAWPSTFMVLFFTPPHI